MYRLRTATLIPCRWNSGQIFNHVCYEHLGRSYPLVTNLLLLLFLFSKVAVNITVAVFLDIREVNHWISGGAFMTDCGNCSPNTRIFKWVDPWTPIPQKEPITWSVPIRKEVAGMSPEDSHLSPHLSTLAVTCWDDRCLSEIQMTWSYSIYMILGTDPEGWQQAGMMVKSSKVKSDIHRQAFSQLGSKHRPYMWKVGWL